MLTLVGRVIQAFIKTALEPEWKCKADIGSYRFRPGRSCHDAIERIHTTFTTKDHMLPRKQWVLYADIKGCFDNISHEYLLTKISTFLFSSLIKRLLEAGYMYKNVFHETDLGTPQDGIISPLLANIALDGIEKELGVKYRYRKDSRNPLGFRIALDDYYSKKSSTVAEEIDKGNISLDMLRLNIPFQSYKVIHGGYYKPISYIRYADDFVVFGESEEDIHLVKSKLVEILRVRGLELSPEKTNIRHITDGFDFLGCTTRSFPVSINVPEERGTKTLGYKLIIKPSQISVKKVREKIKLIFDAYRGTSTTILIDKLNPVIKGWANYFRPISSRKTFESLDAYLFIKCYRYGLRRHPQKGKKMGS